MKVLSKFLTILILFSAHGLLSCTSEPLNPQFPPKILWAWERNEDLRFIGTKNIGVAYLDQTIELNQTKTQRIPRQQPLRIDHGTFLIAVTRIETNRSLSSFSDDQLNETARLILNTSLQENVRGIQIDFDVKKSERGFYKSLLSRVRQNLAKEKSLSITALASFCLGDKWMQDLPIDSAVPMLFEMGADSMQILRVLKSGRDFTEPLCKKSYGFALYEPHNLPLTKSRTRFYFNSKPWKSNDLEKLK